MKTIEDLRYELNLIQDINIRNWTEATLKNVPNYFWIAQASSSGKYHPACVCQEGGLIIHVKRVVYLANHLCEGWGLFDIDRDIVLSACILHDIAKTPSAKYAQKYGMKTTNEDYENHPLNAYKYYSKNSIVDQEQSTKAIIDECICYHMGRWTPEKVKKEITDYSLVELAVYTADYLASRKDLITPKDL